MGNACGAVLRPPFVLTGFRWGRFGLEIESEFLHKFLLGFSAHTHCPWPSKSCGWLAPCDGFNALARRFETWQRASPAMCGGRWRGGGGDGTEKGCVTDAHFIATRLCLTIDPMAACPAKDSATFRHRGTAQGAPRGERSLASFGMHASKRHEKVDASHTTLLLLCTQRWQEAKIMGKISHASILTLLKPVESSPTSLAFESGSLECVDARDKHWCCRRCCSRCLYCCGKR
jgi:hypothetical protein